MQYKFPIRYVGHATAWDEVIIDGDLTDREFIAFYIKDDRVLAAASSKRDTETAAIAELIRIDKMPAPDELRQGQFQQLYPVLLRDNPQSPVPIHSVV
jgi:apoptosis-inducing factor 3